MQSVMMQQQLPCTSQKAAFRQLIPVSGVQLGQRSWSRAAATGSPAAAAAAGPARQQQPRGLTRVHAKASDKSLGLDTSFLTENPVGKLLSGVVGTPLYVGMEVVALLVLLALTDAAFSGDWSRIGAISKDTELVLQKVAIVAWSLHGVCGLVAAKIASSKGRNPATAVVKGILFGSLHIFEQLVLPPVDKQQANS